jgi:hypothetical protein
VAPSVERRRGTYILIFTTVSSGTAYPTDKRIRDMKVTIIELMKTIAVNAKPGDIIEMNTCDEKLTQPSLIPFSEAKEVTSQKNFDLINTIQFCQAAHSNLSICISAALDKLARQSVYYTDFFYVVDNLIKSTVKASQSKSVLRVLTQSRSINSQIIARLDAPTDPEERFESYGPLRVNYLHDGTNDTRNHSNSNTIRRQITIIYERKRSSHEVKRPEVHTVSTSGTEPIPIPVHTVLRFVEAENSTSATSTGDENNDAASVTSDFSSQNTSIRHSAPASSPYCYRVPNSNPQLFPYRPFSFH